MYDKLKAAKMILQEDCNRFENGISVDVMPILHNDDKIILQFCGYSINLYKNNTWIIEDTTG